jgi:NAD(P)-dependent dehydrogenase (short-subunit alcohol dehydrogenase family)
LILSLRSSLLNIDTLRFSGKSKGPSRIETAATMSFFATFLKRQLFHTPPVPTASFKGKTVIVTGSNVGLGLEACRWLVQLEASQVILACRNVEKGKAAAKDIQTTTSCSPETLKVWQLDMSSYASVMAFAEKAKTELPRLDVFLANAGVNKRTFKMTEDDEETITTNVVSLSLLAFLLHPKLQETATKFDTDTHLTITASELYAVATFKERTAPEGKIFATLNDKSTAKMSDRYHVSKLLEVLLVKQMAAMFPVASSKVIINCVAPG